MRKLILLTITILLVIGCQKTTVTPSTSRVMNNSFVGNWAEDSNYTIATGKMQKYPACYDTLNFTSSSFTEHDGGVITGTWSTVVDSLYINSTSSKASYYFTIKGTGANLTNHSYILYYHKF